MNRQPWRTERVFQFTNIFSNAPLIVLREGCCSVIKSCPTFCNPWTTACQAPSLSLRVCSNACPLSRWWYPSHTLPPPSPPTFIFPQHQGLLQWVSSSPQVAKVLEFQLQYQSFISSIVQLPHPYMTTGKTIALTRWTFFGKVMSLLFNTLSRVVIAFLPRSKHF